MFQNRINNFVIPPAVAQQLPPTAGQQSNGPWPARGLFMTVQIADIYRAAQKRAVEDHELDKLFNPGFYDYQI